GDLQHRAAACCGSQVSGTQGATGSWPLEDCEHCTGQVGSIDLVVLVRVTTLRAARECAAPRIQPEGTVPIKEFEQTRNRVCAVDHAIVVAVAGCTWANCDGSRYGRCRYRATIGIA